MWASVLGMCLDFGDAVRAYFHAKARRRVYMDLSRDFEEGKCGLLKKATYGTRDSAQNLEMECTEMMVDSGFRHFLHSVRHGGLSFSIYFQNILQTQYRWELSC